MKGLAALLTLCLFASSHASTFHIPDDYSSIQQAILATADGDTILVAPGLYEESIAFGGRSIVLRSEAGANVTTIRLPLGGSSPVVSLTPGSDHTTVIDGFTLHGRDLVRCLSVTGSSPRVQNCVIEHGYVDRDGGGAFFENGAPVIRNNVVRLNRTDISGGGIFVRLGVGYGTARVEGNVCYGNQAPNGPAIAMMQGEGGVIERNVVYGNTTLLPSERRGAVFVWAESVVIANNTIDGNSLGLTILSSSQVDARNNIITGHPLGGLELQEDVGPNVAVTYDYNDIWDNGGSDYIAAAAAPHDLSVDPLTFVSTAGPYHLSASSPCIDAGDPDPVYNDADGSTNDMGALPYDPDAEPYQAGVRQVPSMYGTIQSAIDASLDGDTVLVAAGDYEESLDFQSKTLALISEAGADQTFIRVPAHGEAAVIHLPAGSGAATRISGFTLQGGGRVRCVEGFGSSPTISECVIEDGYVYRDGGGIFFEHGAPVIENNIVRHNRTRITGGGIFIRLGYGHGTARVVGNVLYENAAPNGPAIGMIQGEGGVIERNVVFANSTILPSICRGAIYVWADDVTVRNNTVDGNTLGVTVMSCNQVDVRNNIITNHPQGGFELREDVGPNLGISHDFNDIWNNAGGDYLSSGASPGDLSVDPQFMSSPAGDFELRSGSACIDAGDPAASFNDPNGTRNDMGALPLDLSGLPMAAGIHLEPSGGIDVVTSTFPTVAWSYYDASGGEQSEYELEVGAERDWTQAELWATGVVTTSQESAPYEGAPLQEGVRYYLRLRVADGTEWGAWREKSFLVQSFVCGNGILETGEECDDGNLVAGDGCDPSCGGEPMVCGNGHLEPGEECDDGNLVAGDGCDPVCQNEPGQCGNGVLEYGEDCDDGNLVGGDGCDSYCDAEPAVCGNGVLEAGEECDDGNLVSGDGCDATCESEHEAAVHFVVSTGSGGDTLMAGVPGSIVFSVHAPETQAVAAFSFPILYTFSQDNLIGPVGESGGGAYLQFSPKATSAFEVRTWHHEHGAAATNPDTTLVGLIDLNFVPWTGSGEVWRINFVPTDTGTIMVDSLTLPPGVPLEAVDPQAANLAIEWSGAAITVVPGYATGDANADSIISSADVILLVNHTFKAGPEPADCKAKGDVNCSGAITASDIIRLVNYIFKAGSPLCNAGGIIKNGIWECP